MEKKINKFIYWTPRILALVFVGFLALMSLDVFSSDLNWRQIAMGLFMHNIPVLILLFVVLISWKHELVGGIIFTLAGLFYMFTLTMNATLAWYIALSWSMTIAGPALLIGILFLVNWHKKR